MCLSNLLTKGLSEIKLNCGLHKGVVPRTKRIHYIECNGFYCIYYTRISTPFNNIFNSKHFATFSKLCVACVCVRVCAQLKSPFVFRLSLSATLLCFVLLLRFYCSFYHTKYPSAVVFIQKLILNILHQDHY